ncbi:MULTISPECIES: methionine/alanine import family NSS transporter small subunit [Clostridium]|uniref:Methionine/alanine import family NSS transporter small subunit n=1 Tax=Clostridium frigoriphilum TaxID=443253 RepID=A0ABU7UUA5_9CLOT|nr:methionine/alanine import family NSS transporter small subunit [Clostridium sp. DSM 17811]MBU3101249.1 methionine/alanine import family NSS transporter small subunit [Clostridium sp. DSM 17811]
MSTSAIVMMIIGCGTVWGGTVVSIVIALAVEKKKNLNKEVKW